MFRSLHFWETVLPFVMDPPLSVSLVDIDTEKPREHPRVELQLTPEDIFTTAVGHPSKRTLAKWHVTSPLKMRKDEAKFSGSLAIYTPRTILRCAIKQALPSVNPRSSHNRPPSLMMALIKFNQRCS
jgi:hypothetical protein